MDATGLLLAAGSVRIEHGEVRGVTASAFNQIKGRQRGLAIGVVNYAGNLTGLQLGVVNYAATAVSGVQIGVVNVIPDNPWFTGLPGEFAPGMVLVNWRF